MRCFVRQGYQRTSMADIIAESGLSAGAIYGYFDGKQELLNAVADHVLMGRMAQVELLGGPPGEGGGPAELVLSLIDMLGDQVTRGLPVQLWSEASTDPEIRAIVSRVFARLEAAITRVLSTWASARPEIAGDDPDAWARVRVPALLSVAEGYLLQSVILEDFDPEAYRASVRALLAG